jgi:hypothetical protein
MVGRTVIFWNGQIRRQCHEGIFWRGLIRLRGETAGTDHRK